MAVYLYLHVHCHHSGGVQFHGTAWSGAETRICSGGYSPGVPGEHRGSPQGCKQVGQSTYTSKGQHRQVAKSLKEL